METLSNINYIQCLETLQQPEYQSVKLIVLDLDDTLTETHYTPLHQKEPDVQFGFFYVYEKPDLQNFLKMLQSQYRIGLWSASKAAYIHKIIDNTILNEFDFEFVMTRRHCKRKYGQYGDITYLKDLSRIDGFTLQELLIVDDTPKGIVPMERCLKIGTGNG